MKFTLSILVCMLLILPFQVSVANNQPIVYAVLFHSPNCPHCRHFLENDYPWYQREFGENFQLIMIDVTTEEGRSLFLTAIDTVPIPENRLYVPMMIIGSEVLVGSDEINENAPDLIRNGLATNGIALPLIPGLEIDENLTIKDISSATPKSSISEDNIANLVAIVLLIGLLFSVLLTVVVGLQLLIDNNRQTIEWLSGKAGHQIQWLLGLITLSIAVTLIMHETADTFATIIALITVTCLLITFVLSMITLRNPKNKISTWSIPIVIIAGLAVATYLSYVEVGKETAACGVMGDCNTVQQSQYAKLFGVLPIGLLGMTGYFIILLLWIGTHLTSKSISEIAQGSLLIVTLIGVAFSSYLTFLEPFIIKATCTWCLTSAAIMLMILWLTFPSGWIAIDNLLSSKLHSKTSIRKHLS